MPDIGVHHTCDIVPKGSHVCRITKYQKGKEVKTLFGMWCAIERFKLEKCQIATEAEALIIQSNCLSGIMKDKLASALDRAKLEGFAPEDIFNDEIWPKIKYSKQSRQKRPKTKHSKKNRQKSVQVQSKSAASSSKLKSNNDVESSSDSDISSSSDASSPMTKHSKKSRRKSVWLKSKSTASFSKSKSNKYVESSSDWDIISSDSLSSSMKSNKKSSNRTDLIYHNAFTAHRRLENHQILNLLRWLARKLNYCWILYAYQSSKLAVWIGRLLHGHKTKQILFLVLRIVWVMIKFLCSLIIMNQRFPMVSNSVQFLKVIILPCQVIDDWWKFPQKFGVVSTFTHYQNKKQIPFVCIQEWNLCGYKYCSDWSIWYHWWHGRWHRNVWLDLLINGQNVCTSLTLEKHHSLQGHWKCIDQQNCWETFYRFLVKGRMGSFFSNSIHGFCDCHLTGKLLDILQFQKFLSLLHYMFSGWWHRIQQQIHNLLPIGSLKGATVALICRIVFFKLSRYFKK